MLIRRRIDAGSSSRTSATPMTPILDYRMKSTATLVYYCCMRTITIVLLCILVIVAPCISSDTSPTIRRDLQSDGESIPMTASLLFNDPETNVLYRFPDDPRSLKENNNKDNNNNNNKQQTVDLSGYSLRFGKCQYVKTYNDTVASSGTGKVFSMQHLVIFRMCPNVESSIDSCGSCEDKYGEYVVSADAYLTQIATHHQSRLEELCESCQKYCNNNNNNNNRNNDRDNNNNNGETFMYRGNAVNCAGCANKCSSSQNLAASGYVDAANYIKCTPFPVYSTQESSSSSSSSSNDDGSSSNNNNNNNAVTDDTTQQQQTVTYYYVGPTCSKESKYSKVTRIRIGVFTDENCWYPASGINVEDLLGYKVSYRNFRTNMSGGNCLSCEQLKYEEDYNERDGNNNNRNRDQHRGEDSVKDVCNNLYNVAAKCETKHGFLDGLQRYSGYYDKQIANELDACTFVDNVVFESYNAYGEIETKEEQHVYERITTKSQKRALLAIMSTIVGFVVYINFLHAEIDEGYPTIRSMLIGQGIISDDDDSWSRNNYGVMS